MNNECLLCGTTEKREVERFTDSHGKELSCWACLGCGFVRNHPLPTEEEIQQFYQSIYWTQRENDVQINLKKQKLFSNHLIGFISRYFDLKKKGLRLLDVASSYGMTLGEISKLNTTSDLYGIEPSESSTRLGRENYRNVRLLNDTVENAFKNDLPVFDVIILSHVLEHLLNPLETLKQLFQKLQNNGVVYIEVPNFFFHQSVSQEHISHFTVASLRNCIVQAGFEIVAIEVSDHQCTFLPLYLSCLIRKSPNPIYQLTTEQFDDIQKKRMIGLKRYFNLYSNPTINLPTRLYRKIGKILTQI